MCRAKEIKNNNPSATKKKKIVAAV